MSSRYVVIGAGAVGATVAAQLHDAGTEVVLVARGAHLAALRSTGLHYVRPDSDRILQLPVVGGPEELTLQTGDVLVLATKSQDTEALLQQWSWLPVEGGGPSDTAAEVLPLVLLQNGLENARAALRRFATVIDAVVLVGSSHVRPGEVVSPSAPKVGAFYLGLAQGGSSPAVERVANDLTAAAFGVQVVEDVAAWKVGKLLGNIAYNLDALYGPSELRTKAGRALRDEAAAALTAAGITPVDVPAAGILDPSELAAQPLPGFERGGSSTWQSLARSGSVESDFLNGEVVLLSRLHGLTAPLNAGVQRRIATAARLGTAPGSLPESDLEALLASAAPHPAVLTDAKQLHDALLTQRPPLVLDVRWALGDPHGHDHYREGHIPGAVYVDLDTELAAAPGGTAGRHPLPDVAAFQQAARGWGLAAGQPVVVYDDNGGLAAARAWWLLRWAGVADVRILDGALAAWRAAGLELETGETRLPAGDVVLGSGDLPVLDADQAAGLATTGVLLDARAGERFRGEVEPIDPRAGHIPGAVSAPTGDNLDADGRFLTREQLRERFGSLGAYERPVGVYCGSGVTAAHQIAALAVAGVEAALFPGSWSAWSSDPERPVAVGPA